MGYRKFMFILPLLVMLTAGCFEQNQPLTLDTHPVIKAAEPLSIIESSEAQMPDIPEITEPNGVLILRQALALALIHNPELRAFSWDVRISEARQLQANLRPNPQLKVEVEEVDFDKNYSEDYTLGEVDSIMEDDIEVYKSMIDSESIILGCYEDGVIKSDSREEISLKENEKILKSSKDSLVAVRIRYPKSLPHRGCYCCNVTLLDGLKVVE